MVEKEKALEIALGQIEKQFGKGAIMKLGDAAARTPVATISTMTHLFPYLTVRVDQRPSSEPIQSNICSIEKP